MLDKKSCGNNKKHEVCLQKRTTFKRKQILNQCSYCLAKTQIRKKMQLKITYSHQYPYQVNITVSVLK